MLDTFASDRYVIDVDPTVSVISAGICPGNPINDDCVQPSPKVMADFFKHKDQHDAFMQFACNFW